MSFTSEIAIMGLTRNNSAILEMIENDPVPPQALAQGVISDAMMKIGVQSDAAIRRVIILQRTGMKESF
jgi:hypothetical protein